eukprot:g8232.t1
MRKFVVSGGFGLLGQRILRHILSAGRGRSRVMVVDASPRVVLLDDEVDPFNDESVSVVTGDLGCSSVAAAIKSFASSADCPSGDESDNSSAAATGASSSLLSVFHLASVMSGQGERDFDEALRVNVDGTRSLLNTCRQVGGRPRFVFASSIAAFGGGAQVDDGTKLLPQSTYGMTKACAELLVNDCTRKGFVDGRIARLPTVIVRPGPPNPAATGCFSSVPKAVLHGQNFVSPVSPDLPHACVGLSSAVQGLIRLHDAEEGEWGARDCAITLPAVSLCLRDLEESASQVARELGRTPGTVSYEPDPAVESVVKAMPAAVAASDRAIDLGLSADAGAPQIVDEYIKSERLQ